MKRYLITGSAGFIGSNIVKRILQNGDKVLGVDNFVSGQMENVDEFMEDGNYEFVKGDLKDFKLCVELCSEVDYVIHQAALGSVPRSVENPIMTSENNINSTLNLLFAAKLQGIKRFVYASSASVYGNIERKVKNHSLDIGEDEEVKTDKRDESMMLAPANPYAVSKMAGEEYAKMFHSVYGLETVSLRYFNVFGPRQNVNGPYAAVVPNFILRMLGNNTIEIHGGGHQFRDFTFVENVVDANLAACHTKNKEAFGKAFNVGACKSTSINQLFSMLAEIIGYDKEAKYAEQRLGDVFGNIADPTLAQSVLQYNTKISVADGLRETVKWYTENL